MKDRIPRRASLVVLGAMLLLVIPASNAFALATISSVSPSAEPANVTTDLKIFGSSFNTLFMPSVSFGPGIAVNSVNVDGSSQLTVNVTIAPNALPGIRTVTVDDGLGAPSSCQCFTVTPPPTVTGISPETIGIGAGTKHFTITGTGFITGATVAISGTGVSAANPAVTNATTMTVDLTVSPTAITGDRNITVTNSDNQFATCPSCFTVTPAPRTTSSGLTPGQRAQGMTNQPINVIGTGFAPGITAAISGTGVTVGPVTYVNSGNITMSVTIAGGATLGARDVTLTNADGGQSTCVGCFAITGPTHVTIAFPSTVNGDIVATFDQPVGGVSSSNSYVKVTGTSTIAPTTVSCLNGAGFGTSCSSGNATKALLHPTSWLIPGQHYTVTIAATGAPAVTDFGGLTVAQATSPDTRAGLIQQGEAAGAISTWRIFGNTNAFGDTYTADHFAGATATIGFSGTYITWFTNVGPNYGIADLYIDGALKATVNCYRSSNAYRAAFTISGLTASPHKFVIRVRGTKGSTVGKGTLIALDAYRVNGKTVDSPHATYTWGIASASGASGGAYLRGDEDSEVTSFKFRGTQIEWDTVLGPGMGQAKVFIDGVYKGTVDNYSSTAKYTFARIYGGLTDSVHTFKIEVLERHRPAANGSVIAIDRWVVT